MALLNDTDGNPLSTNQAVRLNPAANTGGTLTIPAGGANKFHYITSLVIRRAATAALAGTATLAITTTNLVVPGFIVGNAMTAGGTQTDLSIVFDDFPLKSMVANTATTIVLPAPGAAVLWDVLVTYYIAS